MNRHVFFLPILTAGFLGLVLNCGGNTSFLFGIDAAINSVADECAASGSCILVDANGDGAPDGIDTDGDGTPDVPFTPDLTPTPGPTVTVEPGVTPTPTPPVVRSDSGNCIPVASKLLVLNSSGTYKISDLAGTKNLTISVTSSGVNATVNLAPIADLERIIISHSGNTNNLTVINAAMSVGVCNQMSGGSNGERFDSASSAAIADLQSGSGGGNRLQLDFIPSDGLRYSLQGNGHCISAPDGTNVLSESSNDNGHEVNLDGTPCF